MEYRPGKVMSLAKMSREQRHVFLKGYGGDWRDSAEISRGISAPPGQKPRDGGSALIDLVPHQDIRLGGAPLKRIIEGRRSRKEYREIALDMEELSFLLWSSQGIVKTVFDDGGAVSHHLRTVPSSGARHPFETYLFTRNVKNINAGVYRYLALEHKLLPLRADPMLPVRIRSACYGQDFVAEAAAVFAWTAIPRRMEWKYGFLAPKLIAVEAGHVCQNLCLASESVGASACAILGYDQDSMDELAGVSGKDEFVVYMAAVGKV